ncbi:spore germination protein GerW family protein [Promicromonospora sukumoe]|uniref:spore germination protein GerW family protein n=1 Tax=Promicromonospora sukumoe TaxID=88382 RepID=UPI000378142D|nr:spore germination protein GerW family protein [Promicromonospora sukumoe]
MPDLNRISEALTEAFGVRQVYGEPIEREGTLVIPAARVATGGGSGAGGGTEPGGHHARADDVEGDAAPGTDAGTDPEAGDEPRALGEGGGGGFGFGRRAEPAGALVVDDEGVRWVPAVDVNRIVLGGQIAFVLAAAAVAWALTRRRRRR